MNVLKIQFSKEQQKPLRDTNSGSMDHKPYTLSPRLWRKFHHAFDKILLIKRNVVWISGQTFCDYVFFHLKVLPTGP